MTVKEEFEWKRRRERVWECESVRERWKKQCLATNERVKKNRNRERDCQSARESDGRKKPMSDH